MEHIIFWSFSIAIIFIISKLRRKNFPSRLLEFCYIITVLYVGSCYYEIFRNNGYLSLLGQHIYTFKSDLLKLASIVMLLYIILFSLPKDQAKFNSSIYSRKIDSVKLNQKIINTKINSREIIKQVIATIPACFLLLAIIYSLFYFIGGVSYVEDFYTEKIRIVITYFVFCIFYFYLFTKHHQKTEIWSLNGNVLTCGKPALFSIQLSDIEKVIIGRPVKNISDYQFYRYFSKKNKNIKTSSVYLDDSIILKLKNHRYINMNIQHLSGGPEIIQKIMNISTNKIDNNYQFSTEERIAFSPRKRNRIIILPNVN